MISPDATPSRRQLARATLYALLGRLLRRGLAARDLELLGGIEGLAQAVRLPFDEDREAAAHYQLFGHQVFPYESVFRDASGMVGGATTAAVGSCYARAGVVIDCGSESADHIGHELAFLGHVCRKDCSQTASDFLDAHVLAWLPALAIAVRMRADSFWVAVVELALGLALAHRVELGPRHVDPASRAARDPSADAARLLEESATGLRDIARHLLLPAGSGLLLTRGDLLGIARGLRVPCGFGSRQRMLTALFGGAIEYDRMADLVAALDGRFAEWETVLAEYGQLWPPATSHLAPVGARLAASRWLLAQLGDRARDGAVRLAQ